MMTRLRGTIDAATHKKRRSWLLNALLMREPRCVAGKFRRHVLGRVAYRA